jgi:hypothetical protein
VQNDVVMRWIVPATMVWILACALGLVAWASIAGSPFISLAIPPLLAVLGIWCRILFKGD